MDVCAFDKCGKLFTKTKPRQRYCDDPFCVDTRKKQASANYYQQVIKVNKSKEQKQQKPLPRPARKQCICGAWHRNYFDKCNTCRERIASSYDLSMMV